MLLEAGKAWEFVTNLDDAVLVGLEEEPDVTIVYYRCVFILCCFFRCELYVSIYPSLLMLD
jgi:hypothetical protein